MHHHIHESGEQFNRVVVRFPITIIQLCLKTIPDLKCTCTVLGVVDPEFLHIYPWLGPELSVVLMVRLPRVCTTEKVQALWEVWVDNVMRNNWITQRSSSKDIVLLEQEGSVKEIF